MNRLSLLIDKLTYRLFRMFIFWPGLLATLIILFVLTLTAMHGVMEGPDRASAFFTGCIQNIDRILTECPYGSLFFMVCTGLVVDAVFLLVNMSRWYRQWYLSRMHIFFNTPEDAGLAVRGQSRSWQSKRGPQ